MSSQTESDNYVSLTRDSVCMADDVDAPHDAVLRLPEPADLRGLAEEIIRLGYLASIAGGKATWILQNAGGAALALIAQQEPTPRYFVPPEMLLSDFARTDGLLQFHAAYYVQKDPNAVFEALSANSLA